MIQNKHTLAQSFGYAINGIKLALKCNRNLRIHFIVAALVIIAGIFFALNPFEIAIVALMILFVAASEMINTVVEEVVDLITRDYREEAKIAKDVAAGMVLLVASGAFIVGLLVFLPHILRFINL